MKVFPDTDTSDRSRFDFMRSDEVTLLFFRKHGISLIFKLGRHWLPAFFIFLFLFWFEVNFITFENEYIPAFWLYTLNSAYSLLLIHWLFGILINHHLNFMIVTNRNIVRIHKSIFLREDMNQIPFETVQTIHHDKSGFLSNILQYGTLMVESSSANQNIHMHYVPRSELKVNKISEIHGDFIAAPEINTEHTV